MLTITSCLHAQETETEFKKEATKVIKADFPQSRVLNFEYGHSFSREFDSKLFDMPFQEGEISNQKTFNAAANIPIFKTRLWSITGSVKYAYNEFEFSELNNVSGVSNYQQNDIVHFHNMSGALSSTYFSNLFKKPVIYNASVIVDGNDEGLERVKGMIGLSFILKRTERTSLTLGGIVIIDPTAQIPFFPVFSFTHRFKNSQWELDFILPQRLLIRRPIGEKGRFSIGSTFGGNGFYVNVDAPNFPDTFEYSQLEINSGLIYEHKISNSLVATVKGGITNFIGNRLTEKGEPNKDYIYENDQKATGYFNVGFSFDPFLKNKAKKN
ncbi:hypothetical protein [Ulvibacter sp. MAR_2010_11]|uniref:hypothetical protein n=1 Tax=Ulvibacter sp. MAR_2010_11 TaxID=1250229 RepID=UPI001E5D6547|nr:hypothetical protein [Ulvibacter sp. MAR_2010_11]